MANKANIGKKTIKELNIIFNHSLEWWQYIVVIFAKLSIKYIKKMFLIYQIISK